MKIINIFIQKYVVILNYEKDNKICSDLKNNIEDYDGNCFSKCEHSYYKYYDESNIHKKCLSECPDG